MQTWAKQTTVQPQGTLVSTATKLSDSLGETWNRKKQKMLGARKVRGGYGEPDEGNKGQAMQKAGEEKEC